MRLSRFVPRFSLRTLLLLSLLAAGGAALWRLREPWVLDGTLETGFAYNSTTNFSPDSRTLFTIGETGRATKDWSLQCWSCLSHEKRFKIDGVFELGWPAFSRDGSRFITGDERSVSIRNAATGSPIHVFNTLQQPELAAFSPDDRLLSIQVNAETSIWDIESKKQLWSDQGMARFSPDSNSVVLSARKDDGVILCDASTGTHTAVLQPCTGVPLAFFSPDGSQLLVHNGDKFIGMFSLTGAAPRKMFELPLAGKDSNLNWVESFSPDGRITATHESGAVFKTWDSKTGANLATLNLLYANYGVVKFLPDSQRLLVTWHAHGAQIYDARSGKFLFSFPNSNTNGATASPDGRRVAIGTDGGRIDLWSKRRDEYLTGFLWLPEFWLTIALAGAVVWSFIRDQRELRK